MNAPSNARTSGKPWDAEELSHVQALAPDYVALMKVLPHRTKSAIKKQASSLGLTQAQHIWTGAQLKRFRKLYPTEDIEVLLAAFPWTTLLKLRDMAKYYGVRRRRFYRPSGYAVIDQIRTRADELGYNMPELDVLANAGHFFAQGNWETYSEFQPRITQSIVALGGRVEIDWGE